jgi:low temperature requirement protein LtrA
VGVAGYVIMRLALVAQWLRAAKGDPERCRCAHRYAWGVLAVQTAWLGFLFAPSTALFWTLAVCELLVPAWAEYKAPTPWHPHHIAERYGLFTLITLGESILAASVAVQSASDSGARFAVLMPTVAGGLLIVFSFWWLYFELPGHEVLSSPPRAFLWGYGHYFVFASAAAVGAGLAVVVDQSTGRSHISATAAGATVAIPAAAFLFCIWFLHTRTPRAGAVPWAAPLVIGGLLLTPFTAQPVLGAGLLLAVLTAAKVAAGGAVAKKQRR